MQPFVIHAHFYQPERTNPWTGVLDPEPSAAPARDWNERIHGECYRPNGTARIFDEQRRVERIVNNYERLSFNFGPTLLSWMERRHPRTYARVLDGDWRSVNRTGHGNALAQAYNHTILPLSDARDKATQIRWGLEDFRHRFNRQAEGMWLPETAADRDTIDALIDAGVRFTVLAPHQAHRVRHRGGEWREVGAGIDTSRPYRHLHSDGSGRFLAIWFYDGALAQSFAFDHRSTESDVLIGKLRAAAPSGGGLVHAALDGETFGHHRRFGELGLAYGLYEEAERQGMRATSYAAQLAAHPPVDEVEIVGGEGTAWSCAHGVGRWTRDCGCQTHGKEGWNQAWRQPLRDGLDVVRDAAAAVFEERGGALLRDPWAARDDYIGVRLGTSAPSAFLDVHARRNLSDRQKTELWTMLEVERNAMVMYTSCGWFFNDISGIETVYVLRFAARALGLLDQLGEGDAPRAALLEHLGEARSNKPEAGTGADVWREQVDPAAVTPRRIVAHLALQALAHPERVEEMRATPVQVAGHSISVREGRVERRGRVALAVGTVSVTDDDTARTDELVVAGLHLGGIDFHGVTAPTATMEHFAEAADTLWEVFPTEPMAALIRRVWEFAGAGAAVEQFDLSAALPGGRQVIVGSVFSELAKRFHEQYSRLYHDHRRILEMLTAAGYELPRDLRAAAELTLDAQLEGELAAALEVVGERAETRAFDSVVATVHLGQEQGYALDLSGVNGALTRIVTQAAEVAARGLDEAEAARLERWLDLAAELGLELDLSLPQEHFWEAARRARAGRLGVDEVALVARVGTRLGLAPVAWSKSG
jgi:alpha-amylase/alpha-mannosidase (GH57 family)